MGTRYARLVGVLLAVGCDDTLFGVAEGDGTVDPGIEGYAGVKEIVAANCIACHGATTAANAGFGLDLETDLHAATVGVTGGYGVPLVTPGSLDDSLFYLKITGDNPQGTGSRMPVGAPLPQAYVDVIGGWIEGGAPAE